jgi:hypothetical protein
LKWDSNLPWLFLRFSAAGFADPFLFPLPDIVISQRVSRMKEIIIVGRATEFPAAAPNVAAVMAGILLFFCWPKKRSPIGKSFSEKTEEKNRTRNVLNNNFRRGFENQQKPALLTLHFDPLCRGFE